tara:strand:+ start:29106 stop:29276 length:171 start_codon:yes stop_codon:yes gene_type:complete
MIDWIFNNYLNIFAALGALTSAATFITALTPSKKDDEIVGWIRKGLQFISLRLLTK